MSDTVGGKRAILVAAAVGICGAVLGGGTVYYVLIRHKLQDLFNLQRVVKTELNKLKDQVELLQRQQSVPDGVQPKVLKSSLKETPSTSKRTVKFANGYETAEEDEFLTASSDESSGESPVPFRSKNTYGKPQRQDTNYRSGIVYEDESDEISSSDANIIFLNGSGDTAIAQHKEFSFLDSQARVFFKKVDKQFEGDANSQHDAYESLKVYETKFKDFADFWWRYAKATHLEATAAGNNGDRELKKVLAYSACSCAKEALELDGSSSDVHKWFAITLGSKGEYVGTNEKIQNGYIFKEHIDKAIAINPKDSTLHHLLGRFCYEVSQLTWIERRVASTLFSAPPTATCEEALSHFDTAEKIGKPFKDNRLFIAKCYIGMGDNSNAAQWLKDALSLPVLSSSDEAAQDEATKLLQKYQKFLN